MFLTLPDLFFSAGLGRVFAYFVLSTSPLSVSGLIRVIGSYIVAQATFPELWSGFRWLWRVPCYQVFGVAMAFVHEFFLSLTARPSFFHFFCVPCRLCDLAVQRCGSGLRGAASSIHVPMNFT